MQHTHTHRHTHTLAEQSASTTIEVSQLYTDWSVHDNLEMSLRGTFRHAQNMFSHHIAVNAGCIEELFQVTGFGGVKATGCKA